MVGMDSKIFTVKVTLLVLIAATRPGQSTLTDKHSSAPDVGKCSGDQKVCGVDSFDDNFDQTNLLQVQMKVSSHNAEEPQEPEEPEELEEPEEPEEPPKLSEEAAALLQQVFGSLKNYTVDGMDSVCPEATYLDGLVMPNNTDPEAPMNATVEADCKPCADSCKACYGPTMRECVACQAPLVAMVVHDIPHPVIGCIKECPLCFSKFEGTCLLDRSCEAGPSEDEDVLVPVDEEVMDHVAEGLDAALVQEEDEKEEEGEEGELEKRSRSGSSSRRRRRDSSRRRSTPASSFKGDCDIKVQKFQAEIDAWNNECREPKVEKIKSACSKKDALIKKCKTVKKIAGVVKKGSSSTVQLVLKGLGWIPWGVGKGLKAVATVLKTVNGRAATAESKAASAERTLHRFDTPCKRNKQIDAKMDKAVAKGQMVLNKLSPLCGCDCMGSVDSAIAQSAAARRYCTTLPSMPAMPSLPTISLPNWLEDIMAVIASISDKLNSILNREICVCPWWCWCFSIADIMRGISWMLSLAYSPVNLIIKVLFNAFGFGCSSIESCIGSIVGKYLNKIPGLSFNYHFPSPPNVPTISWPSMFPFEWTLPGCVASKTAKCMQDIVSGSAVDFASTLNNKR